MSSKPKKTWDTSQILADAHRIKGQYDHDRRKYTRSSLETGTIRVPAELVIEMLDGDSDKWRDHYNDSQRMVAALHEDLTAYKEMYKRDCKEINTLRKQLAERRYFSETEEIAALKAQLEDVKGLCGECKYLKAPGISPEERAGDQIYDGGNDWPLSEQGYRDLGPCPKCGRFCHHKFLFPTEKQVNCVCMEVPQSEESWIEFVGHKAEERPVTFVTQPKLHAALQKAAETPKRTRDHSRWRGNQWYWGCPCGNSGGYLVTALEQKCSKCGLIHCQPLT